MYNELRKKAKKKVQAKVAFYICFIVFAFTTVVLVMLSFYLPSIAFWLRLPIPIFIMVLAILYVSAFGLPTSRTLSDDWQEDEIEKEMLKLYQKRKADLPPLEELSEEQMMELKELDLLEEKWYRDDDYV